MSITTLSLKLVQFSRVLWVVCPTRLRQPGGSIFRALMTLKSSGFSSELERSSDLVRLMLKYVLVTKGREQSGYFQEGKKYWVREEALCNYGIH